MEPPLLHTDAEVELKGVTGKGRSCILLELDTDLLVALKSLEPVEVERLHGWLESDLELAADGARNRAASSAA